MTTRTIGPFQLDRQIGVGGMGVVYSAIYPQNGKTVAVKLLAPGLVSDRKVLKRFEREMEILKRLNHPNIVKYYGGGTDGDQRYYVMEYIDGGSLLDVLKLRDRLTWDKAIQIGRQVASALEHAHNAGIIHRDLKPANLFLTKKGRLKLGDFGIARDTEATALTAAGKTVGTYAYMAPEQIQAGPAISRKTDLYALGCLLYEVIVGETPFQSENPMDMLMQHLKDDPYNIRDKVPECPLALDTLVDELLAKDPDDRPYDSLAVHTRLGEIRDQMLVEENSTMVNTVIGQQISEKSSKTAKAEGAEVTNKPKKRKKKKKSNESVPFHERTWFLATCLLVLVGATAWMMSRGEDWYRNHWQDGMAGDSYAQREARDHATKYLGKWSDGEYTDEARKVVDEVNARSLEEQLRSLAKRPRADVSPFRQQCAEVVKQETDEGLFYTFEWDEAAEQPLKANPLRVMLRWKALIDKSEEMDQSGSTAEEKNEIRWLTRVCEKHHDSFRRKLLQSPSAEEYFRERMLAAEELAEKSAPEATTIWRYTLEEFGQVDQLKEFSNYVSQRLDRKPADIPEGKQSESQPDTDPVVDEEVTEPAP
jgi:eukaryotic-like serine/threonine-protein kinase